MLDTIYLELLTQIAGGLYYLKNVLPFRITVANFGTDKYGYFVKGYLKNFEIYATEKTIRIKGSLPKFFNGNNFLGLNYFDQKEALILLGVLLEIPIERAIFRRIDIGTTLFVQHIPKSYFPLLVEFPLASRGIIEDSLYFIHNKMQSIFYDKNIESGFALPQFKNTNALRYENKLSNTRAIKIQFQDNLYVSDILHGEGFNRLVLLWQSEYFKISKKPNSLFNMQQSEKIKNESTFFESIAIQYMIEKGEENILQLVSDLQKSKKFSRPEYGSRLKTKIRNILAERELKEGQNEEIKELNSKINEAVNTYLF